MAIIKDTPCSEPVLRQKKDVYMFSDPLSLFDGLAIGDVWEDAKLRDCFEYLYTNKNLSIPSPWRDTMRRFSKELKSAPWPVC